MGKKGKQGAGGEPEERVVEDDLLVLRDEEGVESSFRILSDGLFVGDKQYVVLMPVEQEESFEPEIVVLRVDQDQDGSDILCTIDDDDEWEEVLRAFEELVVDEDLGDYEIEVEEGPEKNKGPKSS